MSAPYSQKATQSRRGDTGGILGVTSRPAVRARIEAASVALSLPPPVFVEDVAEALELGVDRAMFLLDLGSCCRQRELVSLVQAWAAFHPSSEIVVFTPLLDRESELRTAVALVASIRRVEVRILTASDFFRPEVWQNLWKMRDRAALHAELRSDLLAAVNDTGKSLPSAATVLALLAEAGNRRRAPVGDEPLPFPEPSPPTTDRERKLMSQSLRRAGQLPPSWLLVVFRVLWHAKLRGDGWSSSEIARFLGFPSARHFRLSVARRLGVGFKSLRRLSYEQTVRWAAGLLTERDGATRPRSVRHLVAGLAESGEMRLL